MIFIRLLFVFVFVFVPYTGNVRRKQVFFRKVHSIPKVDWWWMMLLLLFDFFIVFLVQYPLQLQQVFRKNCNESYEYPHNHPPPTPFNIIHPMLGIFLVFQVVWSVLCNVRGVQQIYGPGEMKILQSFPKQNKTYPVPEDFVCGGICSNHSDELRGKTCMLAKSTSALYVFFVGHIQMSVPLQ